MALLIDKIDDSEVEQILALIPDDLVLKENSNSLVLKKKLEKAICRGGY